MEKYSDYVTQESFTVVTENRSQSAVMFRNRAQSRHALLYEHQLVFCRAVPGGDTGIPRWGVFAILGEGLPIKAKSLSTNIITEAYG